MSERQPTVEYRDIPGFPGYRVGSDGSVWTQRVKGQKASVGAWRQMNLSLDRKKGYYCVRLSPPGRRGVYRVHTLILLAFVGVPPTGCEGCHNDGDPTNNTPGNLRWDTRASNQADRIRHGRYGKIRNRLTKEQVTSIRSEFSAGATRSSLADRHGVSQITVWKITTNKTHKKESP